MNSIANCSIKCDKLPLIPSGNKKQICVRHLVVSSDVGPNHVRSFERTIIPKAMVGVGCETLQFLKCLCRRDAAANDLWIETQSNESALCDMTGGEAHRGICCKPTVRRIVMLVAVPCESE